MSAHICSLLIESLFPVIEQLSIHRPEQNIYICNSVKAHLNI